MTEGSSDRRCERCCDNYYDSHDDNGYDRQAIATRISRIVGEENITCGEPLSEHTTFRIGGPADIFVTPVTSDQVVRVLEIARTAHVATLVIGRGSNLLVDDDGYRGIVVCMAGAFDNATVEGTEISCEAGVSLHDASEMACELGLSGLEFACGIPGTVGGGVFMNAGAYGSQISDVLASVRVLTPEGNVKTLSAEELNLGYRASRIRSDNLICLQATFDLIPANPEQIRATMCDLTMRREEKQPLDMPSAGSTFKRPEGYFAGKLISDAGLKGASVGGAQVSEKHAGFVVNTGGATARDVRALITHVQDEVQRQFGVRLEPEVRMVP